MYQCLLLPPHIYSPEEKRKRKHASKERVIVDKGTLVNDASIITSTTSSNLSSKKRVSEITFSLSSITIDRDLAIDKRRIHAMIRKAHGAVPQSAVTKKVFEEQSSRHVDGVPEELERDLNLSTKVSSFFFVCVWFRGL